MVHQVRAGLALAICVASLALAGAPTDRSLALGLFLSCYGLELFAITLPGAGTFRASAALALVFSVRPEVGVIPVALGLLIALVQRAISAGRIELVRHFGDALPVAVSLLMGLLVPEFVLLPLLVYLLVYEFDNWLVFSSVGYTSTQRRAVAEVRLLHLAVAMTTATLLALSLEDIKWSCLLLPLLALSHRSAKDRIFSLGADANVTAVERVVTSKAKLSKEKAILEGELGLVQALLEGCRELTGDLGQDAVYDRLQRVLNQLIPHQAGALIELHGQDLKVGHSWSEKGLEAIPSGLLSVAQSTVKSTSALLVSDGAKTDYPAPFSGVRSMLGFPIRTQEKIVGVVLLCHSRAHHFDVKGQAILGVLTVQAGVTLDNSRLYQQVVQAKEALERSQGQLIQAEKLSAIGRLAAGVAHELNTPLGAILLSLEACVQLADSSPETVPSLIGEAIIAAERSQEIIDQLLQYARTSSQQEIVDLSEVVRETQTFLSRTLTKDDIELCTELENGLLSLTCRQHIGQILTNLIVNAKDASQRGSKIRVSSRKSGTSCLLSVEDWGEGISEQDKAKVFDPFFTTKGVGQGTGLGLTVALQLARRHGGDIKVEPKASGGTVFTLTMPYISGQEPDA